MSWKRKGFSQGLCIGNLFSACAYGYGDSVTDFDWTQLSHPTWHALAPMPLSLGPPSANMLLAEL